MQEKEIQLILDPCGGQLRLTMLAAVVGDCVGALPEPVRKGYVFGEWYSAPKDSQNTPFRVTPSTIVTEDFPATLYAHWETPERVAADAKKKKKTSAEVFFCIN